MAPGAHGATEAGRVAGGRVRLIERTSTLAWGPASEVPLPLPLPCVSTGGVSSTAGPLGAPGRPLRTEPILPLVLGKAPLPTEPLVPPRGVVALLVPAPGAPARRSHAASASGEPGAIGPLLFSVPPACANSGTGIDGAADLDGVATSAPDPFAGAGWESALASLVLILALRRRSSALTMLPLGDLRATRVERHATGPVPVRSSAQGE